MNHKNEAEAAIETASNARIEDFDQLRGVLSTAYLLANAHATLYLAEQQRIANLIALYAADGVNIFYNIEAEEQKKRFAAMRDQITEGLGL